MSCKRGDNQCSLLKTNGCSKIIVGGIVFRSPYKLYLVSWLPSSEA